VLGESKSLFLYFWQLYRFCGAGCDARTLVKAQQLVVRLPEWIDSGHQLMVLNEWAETQGLPINLDALVIQINDRLKDSYRRRWTSLESGRSDSHQPARLSLDDGLAFYLLQQSDHLWLSLMEWLPAPVRQPFLKPCLSFKISSLGS